MPNSKSRKNISLNVVLTADEAAQLADVILFEDWHGRTWAKIQLPWRYLKVDHGDLLTFTVNSRTYTIRVAQCSIKAFGHIDVVGTLAYNGNFTSYAVGVPLPAPDNTVSSSTATRLELLDIPMLYTSHNDAGFYIAATGYSDSWPSCTVWKSKDDGDQWTSIKFLKNPSVIGKATTALATVSCPYVWDRVNTVTVKPQRGIDTLSSASSELAVLNGENWSVLGDELIAFATAVDNGDGTFTLSNLLRGRNGTEWAVGGHAIADKFVHLDADAIENYTQDVANGIGEYLYTATTTGSAGIEKAVWQYFNNTAIRLKPYAPTHLYGARDGSNNLTVTWKRRSRVATRLLWVPSVGEDSEEYEADIYTNSSKTSLLRQKTGLTSETLTYTAAEQTADGAGSTSYIEVFQISASVGRGYAGSITA